MNDEIAKSFAVHRAMVDDSLRYWLARVACEAPTSLLEAMGYSLLAPGKRLRPLLVLFAAKAAGGDDKAAMPGACAVEMVHAYSLIHDDLPAMDDDDLRRGQPTCHKKFGEALAILAGDALLTAAFQVVAQGCPRRTAAVSIRELARGAGAIGMVGGQMLDLAADGKVLSGQRPRTVADLENIHRRKTGALIRASLRIGFLTAQGQRKCRLDTGLKQALDDFGRAFGLAFQIVDDILDVEGSAATTGKRVGKDAKRGKLTFPRLLGVEESRRRAQALRAEAIAALRPIGDAAEPLAALARMAVDRDR